MKPEVQLAINELNEDDFIFVFLFFFFVVVFRLISVVILLR